MTKLQTVLGLMSGTSLDGIDVAAIETDGENTIRALGQLYVPYDDAARSLLQAALEAAQNAQATDWGAPDTWPEPVRRADLLVSEAHIDAIARFRAAHDVAFTLVGFHGQTVLHQPEAGSRFRSATRKRSRAPRIVRWSVSFGWPILPMAGGGPLAPLFHAAARKAGPGRSAF